MKNLFTKHPREMGEGYLQHCFFASCFGLTMLVAGIACLIHACLPFIFPNTGSELLFKMLHKLVQRTTKADGRMLLLAQNINAKK